MDNRLRQYERELQRDGLDVAVIPREVLTQTIVYLQMVRTHLVVSLKFFETRRDPIGVNRYRQRIAECDQMLNNLKNSSEQAICHTE